MLHGRILFVHQFLQGFTTLFLLLAIDHLNIYAVKLGVSVVLLLGIRSFHFKFQVFSICQFHGQDFIF